MISVSAPTSIKRRDLICGATGAAAAVIAVVAGHQLTSDSGAIGNVKRPSDAELREEGRRLAQKILRATLWTEFDLNGFLAGTSAEDILSLKKALLLVDSAATVQSLSGHAQDVEDVRRRLLWKSTNILAYPFRNPRNIQYHEVLKWVATEANAPDDIVDSQSTFVIERVICEQLFIEVWDKLSETQRRELMTKIEINGGTDRAMDHAVIASLSGSAALAALTGTAHFAGFAFYSALSTTISTVAGWFGATLPFAAYTSTSSLVAFLTGPVGWALMAAGSLAGIALAGRANAKDTTAAVVQIHSLKVAALKKIPYLPEDTFKLTGR
jgi:uncharacterized protein YaaW (UPF0174 family)